MRKKKISRVFQQLFRDDTIRHPIRETILNLSLSIVLLSILKFFSFSYYSWIKGEGKNRRIRKIVSRLYKVEFYETAFEWLRMEWKPANNNHINLTAHSSALMNAEKLWTKKRKNAKNVARCISSYNPAELTDIAKYRHF